MIKILRLTLPLLFTFLLAGTSIAHATTAPLTLSLDEAILLAVRNNPQVQNAKLEYTLTKFNVFVQQWQFQPHFSFEASAGYNKAIDDEGRSLLVSPGVTLNTHYGTKITVSETNQTIGGYHPGLSLGITQPLMRGFGKPIVDQALNDALDNDVIARMNMQGLLRNTVTSVVNSYLDVVSAEQTVKIDEEALKRAQSSVSQTRKFIKAGHKAGNELVTVEANVATAQSNLANDRNSLQQAQYSLLTAIGIDPNTKFVYSSLDLDALTNKYTLPSLDETKSLVLNNDIQYQTDKITIAGAKSRALMVAKDNTRWQLNFTANASTGSSPSVVNNGDVIYPVGNYNTLFNLANYSRSVGLTLNIPIDDQLAKQQLQSAKVGLQEAAINLQKEKWDKETGAINGWNTVDSAKRSLQFAQSAEALQEKTYNISYQKYLHGLIDSLELQSAQLSLIQSQQSLLRARIAYIKSLVNLDLLTGHTLKTWDIPVRYS